MLLIPKMPLVSPMFERLPQVAPAESKIRRKKKEKEKEKKRRKRQTNYDSLPLCVQRRHHSFLSFLHLLDFGKHSPFLFFFLLFLVYLQKKSQSVIRSI